MCHHSTHYDPETAVLLGWKQVPGADDIQCPSCYKAKKNALVRHGAQLRQTSKPPPIVAMLKSEVKRICDDAFRRMPRGVAISTLTSNAELVRTMQMLDAGGVAEVLYNESTSVRTCTEAECTQIMITQHRSKNATLCPCCTMKKKNGLIPEKNRRVMG